jgi:hypothetical protein
LGGISTLLLLLLLWGIWLLLWVYFPNPFTIRLAFLPYFPYHFTFQLTFLPYFPYHFTIPIYHRAAAAAIGLKFHPKHVTNKNKTKHIMKISHINVNIYDKTVTSQQNSD